MPQRIRHGLHMVHTLPAADRQVAHAGAKHIDEVLAQVKVERDAVLRPPGRRLCGDARADLQRKFAQAVVQRADVAQTDADAA